MTSESRYRIVDRLNVNQAEERRRLIDGLRATEASIEPKYFYDQLGCALYAAICQLDEYYPTRTERMIFQRYRQEMIDVIGCGGTFVDLGAGDCCKATGWLPFLAPKRYLAVDIASPILDAGLSRMSTEFPDVDMAGLVTDFSRKLDLPAELLSGHITLFYPGSSIGNFTPPDAARLLREMRQYTGDGGLLIGVDAKKDKARLDAAYSDALGVTAAFNLNVLRHLNRLIGTNFVEAKWRHVSFYNEIAGRIEMYLQSASAQTVNINGAPRAFAQGERIHSENSYKYLREEFESMLRAAGFSKILAWTNDEQEFWVFYAR